MLGFEIRNLVETEASESKYFVSDAQNYKKNYRFSKII